MRERRPLLAFVAAHPELAARGAEIEADGILRVRRHRLAFHGPPRLILREATVETQVHGLRALPAGPLRGDPGELLGTERAVTVCRDAADDELIIVDSPPLLESVDARLLAASADAVLLVVRAGHTSVRALDAAVHALGEVTSVPVGVVLNGVSAT